jgi:fused signal recognition particle receptor
MARSWAELLGDDGGVQETEEEREGFFGRLRDSLGKSRRALTDQIAEAAFDTGDAEAWERLEEALIAADVGVPATAELVRRLEARGVAGDLTEALVEEATELLGEPGTINVRERPTVILVVGVNGTGKTTTIGKLASRERAAGRRVILAAADTFRAAAADQLETWGSRVGVPTVRSDRDGADPAAVAFDAVRTGKTSGVDVVLVDTAGRLQNKAGLMDELGKITRVITREAPLSEVLLVLDATTGQNGLNQARVFSEVAGVTGIVLTKLDGTAKGGIVVAVQRELGVPVKLVGLGEGPDDLAPFDAESFVDGLLEG